MGEHELTALRAENAALRAATSKLGHDLRSPLTSMLGFGELLEESELDDDQRLQLDAILRAGQRLLEMVNELHAAQRQAVS